MEAGNHCKQAIIQGERKKGKNSKFQILNKDFSLVYHIIN